MAAVRKRQIAPVEAEPELPPDEEVSGADADDVEPERPPRRRRTSKTRAPHEKAVPLRKRLLGRSRRPAGSASGSKERGGPTQMSLWSVMAPQLVTRRAATVGGGALLTLVLIGGLIVGFTLFARSRFFALRGVDVQGNTLMSASEVETMVRASAPDGVMNADLALIRKKLESYPLIRQAQVVRLLPDRLRVTISERTPVALARLSDGSVVCVDEDGALFGDQSVWRGKTIPPMIRGLAETGDRKNDVNRQWLMTYKRLIADLDQNEPPLSSRISEVVFNPDQGVLLTLTDSRIIVLVGRNDFRVRLNAALDVIEAVNSRNAEALNVLRITDAERLLSGEVSIKYLNVTDQNRVVVGLDE